MSLASATLPSEVGVIKMLISYSCQMSDHDFVKREVPFVDFFLSHIAVKPVLTLKTQSGLEQAGWWVK